MTSHYTLFSSLPIDINQELEQEYQRYCIDGSGFYDDGLKDVILFVKFNQETKKLNTKGLGDSERLSYLRAQLEKRMDEALAGFEKKILLHFAPEPENIIVELKNEKKFSPIRQHLFFIKLGLLCLSEEEKKHDKPEWVRVYNLILNTPLIESEELIAKNMQDFLNIYPVFQAPTGESFDDNDELFDEELESEDLIESPFEDKFDLYFAKKIIPFYNHTGNLGLNTTLYAMAHQYNCAVLGDEPHEAHLNLFDTGCTSLNMLIHDDAHATTLHFIDNLFDFYNNLIAKIKTEGLTFESRKDLFFTVVLFREFEFNFSESRYSFETAVIHTIRSMLNESTVEEADLVDLVQPLNELGYDISGPDVNEIKNAFFDMAENFISLHANYFNAKVSPTLK